MDAQGTCLVLDSAGAGLGLLLFRYRECVSVVLWDYLSAGTSSDVRKQWSQTLIDYQWELLKVSIGSSGFNGLLVAKVPTQPVLVNSMRSFVFGVQCYIISW